jgi:hypothetical protein
MFAWDRKANTLCTVLQNKVASCTGSGNPTERHSDPYGRTRGYVRSKRSMLASTASKDGSWETPAPPSSPPPGSPKAAPSSLPHVAKGSVGRPDGELLLKEAPSALASRLKKEEEGGWGEEAAGCPSATHMTAGERGMEKGITNCATHTTVGEGD